MASQKHEFEYNTEKEDFTNEKIDAEHGSVVLEEEENSPIPEVAAIVSTKDDPSLPTLTFRYWIMGLFSVALLSFTNQFL